MSIEEEKKIIEEFDNLIKSPNISKFRKITLLVDKGLGEIILKTDDSIVFNKIRSLGPMREVLPIWNKILNYILEQERSGVKKSLGTVYFSIADCLFTQNMTGWGKFYLKAYLEDLKGGNSADDAPASHALRHRCQLGEAGFLNLQNNLNLLLNNKQVSNLSRREFEQTSIELENKVPLEGNAEINIPYPIVKNIINEIKESLYTEKKGLKWKELEFLCQIIFGSVNGFRYTHNQASQLYQLDGVIYNDSVNTLLRPLGHIIVVEAKNYYKKTISRQQFDIVHANMERSDAKSAFFITSSKISDSSFKEIYAVYRISKKYIIPIYLTDLEEIANEKIFLPILIANKMEKIRKGDKWL
jgi:hypothetical protein